MRSRYKITQKSDSSNWLDLKEKIKQCVVKERTMNKKS